MTVVVQRQVNVSGGEVPSTADFTAWAGAAWGRQDADCEVCVRIVGEAESAALNRSYRGKNGPTNVLSFRADVPACVGLSLLGDIVLCAPLIGREAHARPGSLRAHWAHLTVHGVLHLMGFDHETPQDARIMEAREVAVLAGLGFPDPYQPVARGVRQRHVRRPAAQ